MLCMAVSLTLQAQAPLKKATEAQAKAMVEKINQKATSIKTLACDFTQVKTLRFLNDKMKRKYLRIVDERVKRFVRNSE